jgi:CRISPR/Cas system CSM-associated protein Csm3 (group 7 of RAMP superfamily)
METNKLKYNINFYSDWHAGSGLSSGAETDAVVIKDTNNLPFLPGKTIKGLIKDALYDLSSVQETVVSSEKIERLFGKDVDPEIASKSSASGTLFFSNACLADDISSEITGEMSRHLYRIIASTSIDKNGIAHKGSLRSMEVCIPVQLEGYIDGIEQEDIPFLEMAFKYIRHIGVNRNRGLGRCHFETKL